MAEASVLERRLRAVADMLEHAADEVKASIVELESLDPDKRGVTDARGPGSEAGRRDNGIQEAP